MLCPPPAGPPRAAVVSSRPRSAACVRTPPLWRPAVMGDDGRGPELHAVACRAWSQAHLRGQAPHNAQPDACGGGCHHRHLAFKPPARQEERRRRRAVGAPLRNSLESHGADPSSAGREPQRHHHGPRRRGNARNLACSYSSTCRPLSPRFAVLYRQGARCRDLSRMPTNRKPNQPGARRPLSSAAALHSKLTRSLLVASCPTLAVGDGSRAGAGCADHKTGLRSATGTRAQAKGSASRSREDTGKEPKGPSVPQQAGDSPAADRATAAAAAGPAWRSSRRRRWPRPAPPRST